MEMLRSREEWYKVSIERGTSGDMVMDILKDWKLEKEKQVTKTYTDAEEAVYKYVGDINELAYSIAFEMVPVSEDEEEQKTWELLVLAFFLNYIEGEILAEVKRLK